MAASSMIAAVKAGFTAGFSNLSSQADGVSQLRMEKAPASCSVVSSSSVGKSGARSGLKISRFGNSARKMKGFIPVRAAGNMAAGGSAGEDKSKCVAPLVPLSAVGQFLVTLLESHPHLVPAAVDTQLEMLAGEQEAAAAQGPSTSGSELVLYKRIAEMRAQERRKAIEETMYALIVQRFQECGVPLIAGIPSPPGEEPVNISFGPALERKLECVHSPEALQMVKEHMAMVLGGKGSSDWMDRFTVAQISKLRVGQVYAASVMFGYFFRRVDQRYQLEKTALSHGETDQPVKSEQTGTKPSAEGEKLAAEAAAAAALLSGSSPSFNASNVLQGKPSKLRSYVMSFDADSLQRFAMMRTRESLTLIERHVEALFGKPEIIVGPDGTKVLAKDDSIRFSISSLKRLIYEAIAFGSFLWDVESYVDSHYPLVTHHG